MTTIRICEESEARLMIKDGSFKEYVQGWSNRFPQKLRVKTAKEIHERFGLGLMDALCVAQSMGVDEDVFLEIGDKVCLRKRNNSIDVFQKEDTIWVKHKDGISAFDTAEMFDSSRRAEISLCTEENLLNKKSIEELAHSIEARLMNYRGTGYLMSFGNHEIWTWDNDCYRMRVYSQTINDRTFQCIDEEDVLEEIKRYRETYGLTFGPF